MTQTKRNKKIKVKRL